MKSIINILSNALKKIRPERPSVLLSPQELAEFSQRLNETKMWCLSRTGKADTQSVFRSPQLKPGNLDVLGYKGMRETVARLSARRREILKSVAVPPSSMTAEGRLLACFYRNSFLDTAAESVSNAFIDGWDRPPWDTWIWCHPFPFLDKSRGRGPVVISWVPEQFAEPNVSDAIDANPVNVLRWLSEEKNEFTEQLRAHHLL